MINFLEHILTVLVTLSGFLFGGGAVETVTLPDVAIAGTTSARVVAVIDGDTIDVHVGTSSQAVRVRYIGINTPEPYAHGAPDCGSKQASARNQALVADQAITLVPGIDPYDKFGRLLAYVYVGDTFVNKALIAEGYATVMMLRPNTHYQAEFINLYKTARQENLGIWADCSDVY